MQQCSATICRSVFWIVVTVVVAASESSLRLRAMGSPGFSEITNYTALRFAASPVGIFEQESVAVSVNVGMSHLQWEGLESSDSLTRRSTVWDIPDILLGKANTFYLGGHYSPGSVRVVEAAERTLPLHRFGLTVAAQAPSRIFQLGAVAEAFVGEESWSVNRNTRRIVGLSALEGSIGTQVHPLVRLGMRAGARAKLDTLRDKENGILEDRYFEGQIPRLGWFADVGMPGFPVHSDFCIEIATNRFVYVTKPPRFPNGNEDPWRGDSLAWKWQILAQFSHAGFTYHPSVALGYWRDYYQSYAPTESNDDLNVGAEREGEDWKFSSFRLGIGGAVITKAYAKLWWEYSHTMLKLACGDAWTPEHDKERGYDRIGIGVELNVHAIQQLRLPPSIELFVRLGYCNHRENSGIHAYGTEEFSLMSPIINRSQVGRDEPPFGWRPDQRTYGITTGIGATFLSKALSLDLYSAWLAASIAGADRGLFEFGARLGYQIVTPLRS